MDKIISIPPYEQNITIRDIIINVGIVVRGQLDSGLLSDALGTLITDHWPKLGSRLARNEEGDLEYRVPPSYTGERASHTLTVNREFESTPIPETALPPRTLALHPAYSTIQHLFRDASAPKSVSELIERPDMPIMHLHLTTFADATCVGVSIPHCVADMIGVGIIIRAWTSILAGRPEEVLKVFPSDDVLIESGLDYEAAVRGDDASTRSMLSISSGFLFPMEELLKREAVRLVFLPSSLIQRVRAEAPADTWIGEGDVITAILMKMNLALSTQPAGTPHVMGMTANLRNQLPCLPKSTSHVWLHNAVSILTVPAIPIAEVQTMSLADIALRVRNMIVADRTPAQLDRNMAIFKEAARQNSTPNFFDPMRETGFFVSSWCSKDWNQLDFAAGLKGGQGEGAEIMFHGASACGPHDPKRFWAPVMSKVAASGPAGHWCEFGCLEEDVGKVEQYVKSLTEIA